MLTYLITFVCSLLVALLVTPFVTRLAHANSWYDHPAKGRKIHSRPIPRVGGLAVVLAFFTPLFGLAVYTNRISGLLYADATMVSALCLGATAIVALGLYDDLRGTDAPQKLLVQTAVAVGLWCTGFRMELLGNPFGDPIELGILSLPMTWLWMVGVINALNLIDGLDGLASGTALIASIVLFGVAFVEGAVLLCVFTAALAGALLGFLFFNFNPARIFLGDSGSMFLGYVLAAASLWTQVKAATAVALLIPFVALGLPILDTTLSFVRRLAKGKSPFRADAEHMHHRLIALGLSHRNAVVTLYVLSAIFALGAFALLDSDATRRTIVLSSVAATVFLVVRRIGVVRAPGLFHQSEGSSPSTRDLIRVGARRIRTANNVDAAWRTTIDVLSELGCDEIQLAWHEMAAESTQRREQVLMWRRRDNGSWRLRDPMVHDERRVILDLREEDHIFGELYLLRAGNRSLDAELGIELTRDALIDFCVQRANREKPDTPRVVRSPKPKPASAAGLRSL